MGRILFGPLDALLEWVDQLGDPGVAAVNAIRFGSGLSVPSQWDAGGRQISLGERTLLMAVVNVTDDSFYAESRITGPEGLDRVLERAAQEGADLIDVGGESTRPGAKPVPDEVQRERVVPAIERALAITGLPVSVDTTSAAVANAALDAGATVVNDISAGTSDPDLIPLVAERGAGLVLMHRLEEPVTMQDDPHYDDLCGEIHTFLSKRAGAAVAAGVGATKIAIDPGLGFGKRRQHNFELYRRVAEFHSLGYPLLLGPSRKRHTSGPPDRPAGERLMGTAAACTLLARQGVQILRVHDIGEMRRALETADEIRGAIIEDRVS
jgi:dihydropteroate synthase